MENLFEINDITTEIGKFLTKSEFRRFFLLNKNLYGKYKKNAIHIFNINSKKNVYICKSIILKNSEYIKNKSAKKEIIKINVNEITLKNYLKVIYDCNYCFNKIEFFNLFVLADFLICKKTLQLIENFFIKKEYSEKREINFLLNYFKFPTFLKIISYKLLNELNYSNSSINNYPLKYIKNMVDVQKEMLIAIKNEKYYGQKKLNLLKSEIKDYIFTIYPEIKEVYLYSQPVIKYESCAVGYSALRVNVSHTNKNVWMSNPLDEFYQNNC